MAIFFSCPCGQQLRVDETSASGHTRCLACDRLVRVPSLHHANQALGIDASPIFDAPPPVHSEAPLPVPVLKVVEVSSSQFPPRPRKASPRHYDEDDDRTPYRVAPEPEGEGAAGVQRKLEQAQLRRIIAEARRELRKNRRYERVWPLEQNWYECLIYPLRAMPVLMFLSAAWATLTALVIAVLPETWVPAEVAPRTPVLFFVFVLAGYTFACLQASYNAAREGQTVIIAWPGWDLARAARGGVEGVVCFLAGPVVLEGVALIFWLGSGDLQAVDRLILWELGLVAACYWALSLLAVQENHRFRDANPVAIVQLVRRYGWRVPLAAALMALVVVGHGALIVAAVEELHRGFRGWLWLVGLWGAQLGWLMFLLRWLGVIRYHTSKERLRGEQTTDKLCAAGAASAE